MAERTREMQGLRNNFSVKEMKKAGIYWIVWSCKEFNEGFSASSRGSISASVNEGRLTEKNINAGNECWKMFRLE